MGHLECSVIPNKSQSERSKSPVSGVNPGILKIWWPSDAGRATVLHLDYRYYGEGAGGGLT